MSKVKRCVQCGVLKEEDEFRQYTYSKQNATGGRYRICKNCEAINMAYKRAKALVDTPYSRESHPEMYSKALDVVEKTEQLFNVLTKRGLRVPTAPAQPDISPLDKLLAFYETTVATQAPSTTDPAIIGSGLPDELKEWLNADMSSWHEQGISPEYLQETVYESLKAKYRPQLGVDKETYMPLYDDTFKDALNKILRRFDDYEEEYSAEEEED